MKHILIVLGTQWVLYKSLLNKELHKMSRDKQFKISSSHLVSQNEHNLFHLKPTPLLVNPYSAVASVPTHILRMENQIILDSAIIFMPSFINNRVLPILLTECFSSSIILKVWSINLWVSLRPFQSFPKAKVVS